MRNIELDGSVWTTTTEFYDALLAALGAPRWHGQSIDALIDSIIYGGINTALPPYKIHVRGLGKTPNEVRKEVELVGKCLTTARQEYIASRGEDIEVQFEIE